MPRHRAFALRVTSTGDGSWSYKFWDREARRSERVRLGAAGRGGLSLSEARVAATAARARRDAGYNPAAERRSLAAVPSFDEMAIRYLEYLTRNGKSSLRNDKSYLVRPRERWKNTPINRIDRRAIVELVEDVGRDYPRTANATLTTLKGLFAWAVDRAQCWVIPPPSILGHCSKSRPASAFSVLTR